MQLEGEKDIISLIIKGQKNTNFITKVLNEELDIRQIGELFEKSLKKFERKNKGQFYTPSEIVDYITSYLDLNNQKSIIDPACGCASFLVPIIRKIQEKEKKPDFSKIYGIDINRDAVEITKLSLIVECRLKREYTEVFNRNIITGNSIVENKEIDPIAINWKETFKDIIKSGGFDIIIGNPPYITLKKEKEFDPNESIYQNIINKNRPVSAVTLMIGKSLEYLKKGGFLAFVLPKTILYVDSYSKLREYILQNTSIIHIFDLGIKFKDVRGEQIILILKKEKPSQNHLIEIKSIKNPKENLKSKPSFFIQQNIFKTFGNKILAFDNNLYYSIIQKIRSKGKNLNDIVNGKIFRGLTLNKKVFDESIDKSNEKEKIIKGRSIAKFRINNITYINKKHLENISKNTLKKLKNKKIVLQNIFSSESGIIAAYDEEGILTLDTVTNIIVNNEDLAKYLLGIFHSKLINFYVSFALFNRSRLTMHLDKNYIGEIPIVYSNNKEMNNIQELVDDIVNGNKEIKDALKLIDKEVYKIYDLTIEEIKFIETEMRNLLSKKSIW